MATYCIVDWKTVGTESIMATALGCLTEEQVIKKALVEG
jgi:hypothetical protein